MMEKQEKLVEEKIEKSYYFYPRKRSIKDEGLEE